METTIWIHGSKPIDPLGSTDWSRQRRRDRCTTSFGILGPSRPFLWWRCQGSLELKRRFFHREDTLIFFSQRNPREFPYVSIKYELCNPEIPRQASWDFQGFAELWPWLRGFLWVNVLFWLCVLPPAWVKWSCLLMANPQIVCRLQCIISLSLLVKPSYSSFLLIISRLCQAIMLLNSSCWSHTSQGVSGVLSTPCGGDQAWTCLHVGMSGVPGSVCHGH